MPSMWKKGAGRRWESRWNQADRPGLPWELSCGRRSEYQYHPLVFRIGERLQQNIHPGQKESLAVHNNAGDHRTCQERFKGFSRHDRCHDDEDNRDQCQCTIFHSCLPQCRLQCALPIIKLCIANYKALDNLK